MCCGGGARGQGGPTPVPCRRRRAGEGPGLSCVGKGQGSGACSSPTSGRWGGAAAGIGLEKQGLNVSERRLRHLLPLLRRDLAQKLVERPPEEDSAGASAGSGASSMSVARSSRVVVRPGQGFFPPTRGPEA